MGTICAPLYANIFMSEFEEKHIYHLIKSKSVIYLRHIDNIFMVLIKSESELRHFMNKINQKHQSIKFDFKFSKESIYFLDTLVYINSQNRLQITLYKKTTDCQKYLHAKLARPFSLKKSILYRQALRIKCICSTFEEYRKHSLIHSSFKEVFNSTQLMIAFHKNKLKTTYRNKHNKKQPKISHNYTNNNHRLMYPIIHQSIALLPRSYQSNNMYKHSNQRDLYNFSPSHLP